MPSGPRLKIDSAAAARPESNEPAGQAHRIPRPMTKSGETGEDFGHRNGRDAPRKSIATQSFKG